MSRKEVGDSWWPSPMGCPGLGEPGLWELFEKIKEHQEKGYSQGNSPKHPGGNYPGKT